MCFSSVTSPCRGGHKYEYQNEIAPLNIVPQGQDTASLLHVNFFRIEFALGGGGGGWGWAKNQVVDPPQVCDSSSADPGT